LSHALPLQKISSKSVHKFASNPTDRQTDKQTDKQTAPKTLPPSSAEVIIDNRLSPVLPLVSHLGPVAPISVNFNHQLAYFADQSDTTHVPHQPTAVA